MPDQSPTPEQIAAVERELAGRKGMLEDIDDETRVELCESVAAVVLAAGPSPDGGEREALREVEGAARELDALLDRDSDQHDWEFGDCVVVGDGVNALLELRYRLRDLDRARSSAPASSSPTAGGDEDDWTKRVGGSQFVRGMRDWQREPAGGEGDDERSYWRSDEGRLNEAIRQGLRDAGVQGTLAQVVGPIMRRIAALAPPVSSVGEGRDEARDAVARLERSIAESEASLRLREGQDAPARERFILRENPRWSLPFVIVRQVQDHDFLPDDPVWVDAGELGAFPSRDAARDFMRARDSARESQWVDVPVRGETDAEREDGGDDGDR